MNNYEERLIKIIDCKIEGRCEDAPGLFNVIFKLNAVPDDEWIELFNHPSRYITSIHMAGVIGDEIHWSASDDHIKNKKEWIYSWVEDANKRYMPVLQEQSAKEEATQQKAKIEASKIDELQSILKNSMPIPIKLKGSVMFGFCDYNLDGCTAKGFRSPITQIQSEEREFIDICQNCLDRKIKDGTFIIKKQIS